MIFCLLIFTESIAMHSIPLTEIFCNIDDFHREFEDSLSGNLPISCEGVDIPLQIPPCALSPSEMMTLVVAFHLSNYRTFKHFYQHVRKYWRHEFPNLVCYERFVALQAYLLVPLCLYLNSRKGRVTGISFIDSTSLIVCHNRRIHSNRVFKDLAKRGKNSMGWFFGFKLHIIINDKGELLAFKLTPANRDDRTPVPEMTREIWGKLFGDKGYISQPLFDLLFKQGLQLITKIKKNMKNKLMPMADKILLRKRAIIESVNDQLKNISQIEHTRHRSMAGFMLNLLGGLIAYTYQGKKPSLNLDVNMMLPAVV
jgi:hypothetical protein